MPRRHKKHHPNLHFSIRGGLFWEKESPKLDFEGLRTDLLCSFEFYRTAIFSNIVGGCYFITTIVLIAEPAVAAPSMAVT